MIRPININLNAAHPELPLVEATTFTGAPSSVFIRGVPKAVGNWSITAVSVAVTYPNNTTTARAAVESAEGVWVATIPGTATSGRTAAGFKIMADGIDENGAAVTGYVLGFADFSVLSFTPVPAPGGTFYFLRYFDQAPATPKEGDVAKIDGVLKFYNGSAWESFAAPVTLDNAVTRTSANGVKSSGIWSAIWGALSALPAGFTSLYDWCVAQLAGKASTADATLTPKYADEWIVNPVYPEGYTSYTGPTWSNDAGGRWYIFYHGDSGDLDLAEDVNGSPSALSLSFQSGTTATRQSTEHTLIGYVLGSQSDKPLASEAEAEALRTGKQDALTTTQLANIAAVPGKLDKNGDTMTGSLHMGDNCLKWQNGNLIYWLSTNGLYIWNDGDDETHSPNYTIAFPLASGTLALTSAIPYALVTKTITNGAVTLDDRASNAVTISTTLSPNTLMINFPTATSGKVRDFAMRLNIAAGVTAPEIAWPQGVTLENDGGEVPEIADGGTGGSSTILYFSESENNGTTAKFTVKGETLTAITQA